MSPNLHRRVADLESKSPARKLPPLRVVLVGIEPLLSADGNRVLGPGKVVRLATPEGTQKVASLGNEGASTPLRPRGPYST